MVNIIYRLSAWIAERARQRMIEKRCNIHDLGAGGYCRKCGKCPLYGKVAYAKGKCLWYIEIDSKSKFDPSKITGAYMPQYKRKEALDNS